MKSWKLIAFCAFLVSLTLVAVGLQRTVDAQRGGAVESDPYEVVPNWPQPLHKNLTWGRIGAVYAESANRIYLFTTGELPTAWLNEKDPDQPNYPRRGSQSAGSCAAAEYSVPAGGPVPACYKGKPIPGSRWEHLLVIVDAKGKLIESWEQHNHLFTHPHGILIDPNDPERHVWVIDDGSEQIFKFTRDGKKLVMTIGEFRVKGNDQTHLGGPNGMAFLPNGDFYVSDGYKNSRVVKFSKDGKYLMEFGKPPTGAAGGSSSNRYGPGVFRTPHSVEVDAEGRIYVGDRGNYRIQIFDKNANYLREITAVYPNGLAISKDQRYLYVAQGGADGPSEIRKYTVDGRLLLSWGRPRGAQPGQLWGVHDFSTDSDGNLYLSQSFGGGAWKYRHKKGADPTFLVGRFNKNSFTTSTSQ
jgi:peptidylamidoglycolate lyase